MVVPSRFYFYAVFVPCLSFIVWSYHHLGSEEAAIPHVLPKEDELLDMRTSVMVKQRNAHPPTIFHLIPHSNCDAAYEKTFDEYYETQVRTIFHSVLSALQKQRGNHSRRFVWAETNYLSQWWKDPRTSSQLKDLFHTLMVSGRIEIVNGGWVMQDEGITRYDSQIHQMTHGHDQLQQIFVDRLHYSNLRLTTGWQIASFGSSPFTVHLHHWAGYDMLVLNRMPDSVKAILQANRTLQFYWTTPDGTSRILVHVLDAHYTSPHGFNWEDNEFDNPVPVTRDNVQERSDLFVKILQKRATYYRTAHVMIPMGGDFTFHNASLQFQNMERIIRYVHNHPDRYGPVIFRYSTVREYKSAVLSSFSDHNQTIPTIQGGVEFQSHFTGSYFQSPHLKQSLRSYEILLRVLEIQVVRTLETRISWTVRSRWMKQLKAAREAAALMQHHNAITGTSYRFVIADYMQQLASMTKKLTNILAATLVVGDHGEVDGRIVGGGPYLHETVLIRNAQSARSISLDKVLNPRMGSEGIVVSVLNSLGRTVSTMIHFVCARDDVAITLLHEDGSTTPLLSQATPLEKELDVSNLGLFLISFQATVTAMSHATFRVLVCDLTRNTFQNRLVPPSSLECAQRAQEIDSQQLVHEGMGSARLHVVFNQSTLELSKIINVANDGSKISTLVDHDFILYYGGNDTVYEFTTNLASSNPPPLFGSRPRALVSAFRGPLFSQVTLEYSPWLVIRYRLLNVTGTVSDDALQVSAFAGPLPPSVNLASRFRTNLSGTSWYVDQNGYLPTEVSYNRSHGVGEGNTRPLVSRTWISEKRGKRFSVFSVDPRACVSKNDGHLDIFWHRRNKHLPDWWKQGDDRSSILSSVWLTVDGGDSMDEFRARSFAYNLANDMVALSHVRGESEKGTMIIADLPAKLHIMSFRVTQSDTSVDADREDRWIDLQLENLSDESAENVDIEKLLEHIPEAMVQSADLRPLSYLTNFPSQGDDHGCILDSLDGGMQVVLRLESRRICSLRIPLSPLTRASGSYAYLL